MVGTLILDIYLTLPGTRSEKHASRFDRRLFHHSTTDGSQTVTETTLAVADIEEVSGRRWVTAALGQRSTVIQSRLPMGS